MSAITAFSFENNAVRTLGTPENPLFVAIDVAKALGYSQPAKSVIDRVDSDDLFKKEIETKGGRQTVNCVNESGLYALIFGSKLESAKRFKRWVTSEVLPAIRKTGKFECPANPKYITPQQGWLIQSAVQKRVHRDGVEFQTVYQALKARYQIPKYTFLQEKDFDEAIRFIETCALRTPARKSAQRPETQPEPIQLTDSDLKALMTFIYVIRFLGQDAYNKFYAFLKTAESPLAPRVWSAFHEVSWTRIIKILAANGFDVSELDCYQCLMASRAA